MKCVRRQKNTTRPLSFTHYPTTSAVSLNSSSDAELRASFSHVSATSSRSAFSAALREAAAKRRAFCFTPTAFVNCGWGN
jgi:hypothetical protein